MAEIKRDPYRIDGQDTSFVAFDEDHTLNDILRYVFSAGDIGNVEEVIDLTIDAFRSMDIAE